MFSSLRVIPKTGRRSQKHASRRRTVNGRAFFVSLFEGEVRSLTVCLRGFVFVPVVLIAGRSFLQGDLGSAGVFLWRTFSKQSRRCTTQFGEEVVPQQFLFMTTVSASDLKLSSQCRLSRFWIERRCREIGGYNANNRQQSAPSHTLCVFWGVMPYFALYAV